MNKWPTLHKDESVYFIEMGEMEHFPLDEVIFSGGENVPCCANATAVNEAERAE